MFRKLHINLTIFVGIVLTVFMIFITNGIYYITKIVYEEQISRLMSNEAIKVQVYNMVPITLEELNQTRANFSLKNRLFLFGNQKLNSNYFSYDESMNYIVGREQDSVLANEFSWLVKKAINEKRDIFQRVKVYGSDYRVFTKYIDDYGKTKIIQIYNDASGEAYFFAFLRTTLTLVGGVGILMLIVLSYLFTGKVLRPVKETWQKQKEFVADASHELRTPLTVIQTNLDVMKTDEDATVKEYEMWLDNAYSETRVMADLIDQLLTLAKVDANETKVDLIELSLSEIAENVVDNMQAMAMGKNILLETSIDKDVVMKGDYDKIRRLVVILLENAIKYTEEGKVVVSVYNDKKTKVIQVEDTGIGMSKEDIPRIFDRFYRGDKARNRKVGGTGLGLSIAKWIVDSHKGKINVESEVGKGSKFTVEFN